MEEFELQLSILGKRTFPEDPYGLGKNHRAENRGRVATRSGQILIYIKGLTIQTTTAANDTVMGVEGQGEIQKIN